MSCLKMIQYKLYNVMVLLDIKTKSRVSWSLQVYKLLVGIHGCTILNFFTLKLFEDHKHVTF